MRGEALSSAWPASGRTPAALSTRARRLVASSATIATAALIPLLAACLTGCGGAAGRYPPPGYRGGSARIVRAAAARMLASSARVRFRLDGAQTLGPSRAQVQGLGELDFVAGRGIETIDLGEVRRQEPGTEHVIFLGSRVYLQPRSRGTAVLPKGKAWVSATLAGPGSVATNFPSFALQVEAVNPQLLLAQLAAGAVAAVPGRSTVVNGALARSYAVTVDLGRALGALGGPAAALLGEAIRSELAALGTSQAGGGQLTTITAWIDTRGRIVALRSTPPGAGVGTYTTSLCCFGSAVGAAAPAASQVIDIASLTPTGERENNGGGDSDGG